MALVETWTHKGIGDEILFVDGYEMIEIEERNDHGKREGRRNNSLFKEGRHYTKNRPTIGVQPNCILGTKERKRVCENPCGLSLTQF